MNFSDSNDICDTCGSRLLPRANYCHFCGKKLATGPGVKPRAMRGMKEQIPSKPKVTRQSKGAGAGPMLGCVMAGLILLVLAAGGVVGGGVWWFRKTHQPRIQAKQEQVQAELAAAVKREREARDRESATSAEAAKEKKTRESFEQRVGVLEGDKEKLATRIAGLERKLKIEARLRNGAESFIDGGRFEKAAGAEEESEFSLVPDPAKEDNQVLVLADQDVYSAEMWIPEDVDAVRVRVRVLVPFADGSVNPSSVDEEAGEDEEPGAEEGAEGEAEAGAGEENAGEEEEEVEDDRAKKQVTVRIRLLDESAKAKSEEVVLLSSDDWLKLDVIFNELGGKNRRFALEVSGFEGEIYVDDIEVVDAYPMRLEPSVFKYYESPAEKVYYWFALRLEAAHRGNVDLELPRVRGRQIDLNYELNGEKQSHRFQNFKIEPDAAEVTVGPSGGSSRLYRLEKGRDGAWSIVQILESG